MIKAAKKKMVLFRIFSISRKKDDKGGGEEEEGKDRPGSLQHIIWFITSKWKMQPCMKQYIHADSIKF